MSKLTNPRFEARLFEGFKRVAYSNNPNDKVLRITPANFVNLLYRLKVVERKLWPTPRIVEEMYARGYMRHVSQKMSYGPQTPDLLDFDQVSHYSLVFRLLHLKSVGTAGGGGTCVGSL